MLVTAILPRKVSIFQGWTEPAESPDWTGSIEEFWSRNETLTWGDIRDMAADLDAFGYHHFGGGATGCFTFRYAKTDVAENVAAIFGGEVVL